MQSWKINKNCKLEKQQQKVKLIITKLYKNKLYKLLQLVFDKCKNDEKFLKKITIFCQCG